ncbi:CHASE2 domain-containing protein [Ekhidna sp.]|mmetsp:Transcript_15374/g.38888  ORF Transcript_15374/g.38888 Transcript_15374/m.38888 type:complete len:419 (+) Transcript_15374:114-1370(+)
MFRRFWRDVILGTIFIFALMGLFGSLTAFKVFDIMDPIGEAFADMEFTDVYFSQLLDDPVADQNVVLVNVGLEPRAGIAILLDSISKYDPAVIGVDLFFDYPKEDTLGDLMLMEALGRVENLVLVTKLSQTMNNLDPDSYDSLEWSDPMFTWNAHPAFANLVTDAGVQEDLKMCRTFVPQLEMDNGENQVSFAVKMASFVSPEKADKFLARGNEEEVINYRGNVLDYGATKFGNKYTALDVWDVYNGNFVPEIIQDKVVIFCFLGEELGDRENFEDKFFTPLNEVYVGRAFPDMYGGVIHANIVSMVLNEDYIYYLSDIQSWVLTVIMLFFTIMVFSWIYKKLPKWYDGITKVIQVILLVGIPYIMIYAMDLYSVKLELNILLIAIALSGDGLEVFYGVVKNSLSKEGRKELFKVSRL